MTDFKNPGLQAFTTGGARDDGIAGRYVRVTATKLAPAQERLHFRARRAGGLRSSGE
ncbi:MAG: hypothetical protein WDN28_05215 [Chthoniobacter sp.]